MDLSLLESPPFLEKKVYKFLEEFSLFASNLSSSTKGPLNTFRGGAGSSTIDYIAVPTCLRDEITSSEVLEDAILNTSDHNAVRLTMRIEGVKI